MIGGLLMVLALVIVIPIAVTVTGAILAALLGWSLRNEGEAVNEGSELIPLNR